MARKKTVQRPEQPPLWPSLDFDLHNPRLQQAAALLVALLGLLLALALLGIVRAAPIDALSHVVRLLFGLGSLVFALSLIGGGLWLVRALMAGEVEVPWRRVVGGEIFFFALLALIHMPFTDGRVLAESGGGGGMAGWAISSQLANLIGDLPATVLLLMLAALGLVWAVNLDWMVVGDWVAQRFQNPAPVAPLAEPVPTPAKRERAKPAAKNKPVKTTAQPVEVSKPARRIRRDKRLPALDIFRVQSKLDIDREEMNKRARVIEETLDSFGIPVKVVEMQQGPTVTQFGLQPGYIERRMPDGQIKKVKVKVSRIASLANDLALALAAAPIRIEAPVPGKPVVGVEVPNMASSMVSLRSVLDSDSYRKFNRPLKIALGQDVAGTPIFADLAAMPHVLIAGATGSGKSVCINAMIASLLCNNTPDELRFLMMDPKMVELVTYNGIPHLLHPVVTDLDKAAGSLQWAMREMDQRYLIFKQAGTRNIEVYNQAAAANQEQILPYVLIVIDELADLMMTAPEEIEKTICRLAQMARATGIHLVLATQRPSVDVVTGLIKANFPARISFAVTSQTDSRVILDTGGAEKLLGRGDMLYMAPDSAKLQRLQGCYVSDDELSALVQHWRHIASEEQLAEEPIELPAVELAASKEKSDELLDEAIELVRQFDRASTSFLQRRMGIGYNRAAKLIDLMEERGIIGPAKEGGLAREVLLKADASEDDLEEE